MATKLSNTALGPGSSKYPWDDWLDGSVWELEPGTDFKITVRSFQALSAQAALRRHLTVRTRNVDGKLRIQAEPGAGSR